MRSPTETTSNKQKCCNIYFIKRILSSANLPPRSRRPAHEKARRPRGSLLRSVLSQTVSLRGRRASEHLLRPRSLAALATEAPLPPDPHLVFVRRTMRPSGNSSASWCCIGSFLFTCRKIAVAWPSISTFHPTMKRWSELSPGWKTQARYPEERKPPLRHLLPQRSHV